MELPEWHPMHGNETAVLWIGIAWFVLLIAGIFLYKRFYAMGEESGNKGASWGWIVLGICIGLTLIPGIGHLKGANAYEVEED